MRVRSLARDGVLTAVALTVFIVELQIPEIVPVPGVKLGLANIVTVVTMFTLGPGDALAVLLARILLGGLIVGNPAAIIYSLSGGLTAYLVLLLTRKIMTEKQIWVSSVFAALGHNLGQIGAAIAVTGTPSLIYYLPVLAVSGIIAGAFTGLAGQLAVKRLGKALRR